MFTSLLVAGAVAFCSGEPSEPRCSDTPIVATTIVETHRQTFVELARGARLREYFSYVRERYGEDEWRIVAPPNNADCEDRLLWVAEELRRRHPELTNAYRFVALQDGPSRTNDGRINRELHLVLVIEGYGERIVIDTRANTPRDWDTYARWPAYTALSGMGRSWTPYS